MNNRQFMLDIKIISYFTIFIYKFACMKDALIFYNLQDEKKLSNYTNKTKLHNDNDH